MKIQFLGAAREVTGSKHLITTKQGTTILLDCGMFQGKGLETDTMNRTLGFDPKDIHYILLSHAHIDHSGLIPFLYKRGFRGTIICTPATRDLCRLLLADTAFIQALDVKWYNKKPRQKRGKAASPLYGTREAEDCMRLFETAEYNQPFAINDAIRVCFTHSGHMLGSAVINIEINEDGETKRIAYTGDIGRNVNHILVPPQPFPQCDYLICESTYGDRLHDAANVTEEAFLQIVNDTCVRRQGKLIIPSFSVGRMQEIVYVLNNLFNEGRLPQVPVYVDSPLSVNATHIFRKHTDDMNEDVREVMLTDSNPFGFNTLHYISDIEDSKALNTQEGPAIIISSSGMLEAGRVKHHVANHIEDPSTTILIAGYCTPTSLGARIQEPDLREVSIFGMPYKLRAQVRKVDGFSGHGDFQDMIHFFGCQDKQQIRKIFLVHGEAETAASYRDRLRAAGFRHIEIPYKGETFKL